MVTSKKELGASTDSLGLFGCAFVFLACLVSVLMDRTEQSPVLSCGLQRAIHGSACTEVSHVQVVCAVWFRFGEAGA